MIVMSEKKENLGKAFGFRRMFDTFGAIIGPLIAMIILAFMLNINVENTYRFIFTVALIPAVLAVLILFFIKEESAKMQDEKKIIMSVLNAKNYKNFIFVSLIFAIGEFTIALFLLRAGEFVNILYIPLLGMIFNIFYAMFSVPAGHLTDRIGAKKSLIISWIIFMLAAIGFAFFASFQSVFIFCNCIRWRKENIRTMIMTLVTAIPRPLTRRKPCVFLRKNTERRTSPKEDK